MKVMKVLGLAAVGATLMLARLPTCASGLAQTVPAPRRRSERMPSRQPPRCAGRHVTTAGIAPLAADQRGVSAQTYTGPESRACFRFSHETGTIACRLFRT